ncbi:MAG: FAD-dependent oxidoreductase [Micromonosporaceae bacterium]|nr:FAD-dependent oxidoreductase [Micromonosporaceae bacterium]
MGGSRDDEVAVVGAGLAGCLLACFLARRGHRVTLYERRADPRTGTASGRSRSSERSESGVARPAKQRGRSINLALSERGLDALRRIGLAEAVLADALPMRGRMIHPVAGPLDFQPYSADGQRAINSIGRGALNNTLLSAATAAGAQVHFDHRLVGVDPASGEMTFEVGEAESRSDRRSETAAGDERKATAAVVLGADGAGSAVRGQLLAHDLLTERVEFLDHGYKELTVPPAGGDFALDPGALHIWPRGTLMMIALPNPDRSFTCTLFWPASSFAALDTPEAIAEHFATHYPDVPPLAPDLVADYQHNPVGQLGTVYCEPWQAYGRVGLVGDAAHAIVPFYGQGANCAFEDVVELDRCLDDTGDDWRAALPRFGQHRREHTDAIAQLALDNFVEMRDRVASPVYQLRKKVEHGLERALPGRYVSRYELVSFTTTPYAQVRRRVRRQQWLLGAVAAGTALLAAGAVAVARRWRR